MNGNYPINFNKERNVKRPSLFDGYSIRIAMWVILAFGFITMLLENPYDRSEINMWLGGAVMVIALIPISAWLGEAQVRMIPL